MNKHELLFYFQLEINPAGLVLEFEIGRLSSFIGEHFDYFLFLLVSRTGTVGWNEH